MFFIIGFDFAFTDTASLNRLYQRLRISKKPIKPPVVILFALHRIKVTCIFFYFFSPALWIPHIHTYRKHTGTLCAQTHTGTAHAHPRTLDHWNMNYAFTHRSIVYEEIIFPSESCVNDFSTLLKGDATVSGSESVECVPETPRLSPVYKWSLRCPAAPHTHPSQGWEPCAHTHTPHAVWWSTQY